MIFIVISSVYTYDFHCQRSVSKCISRSICIVQIVHLKTLLGSFCCVFDSMIEPNVNGKSCDLESHDFTHALYTLAHSIVVFRETATRSDDKHLYFKQNTNPGGTFCHLKCRYLNPHIKLKLIELAFTLDQMNRSFSLSRNKKINRKLSSAKS